MTGITGSERADSEPVRLAVCDVTGRSYPKVGGHSGINKGSKRLWGRTRGEPHKAKG